MIAAAPPVQSQETQQAQPEPPAPQARPGVNSPQEPRARKLTLREAFDLANRQNLDLAAARLRLGITQAGVRIARQRPNPTASFGASRDTPHESVLLEQPLELGLKRRRRIELAQQQIGITEVEIESVARQVRRRVREAFYGLMLGRGISDQRAQALQLARRLRQIAQERYDAGDVPQLEIFQADLEVSRAEAELAVAQQRERVGLSQLNAVLNEPPETRWGPSGSLEDMPLGVSLTEMVQRAAATNAELQRLIQEQKVEQSHRALLRAERVPNLNVQVGTDLNSPPDFQVGPRGQLSMALPLFSRNQGEIAQSSATLRALEAETSATRRSVAARVEAAYYEWSTRQAQAQLFRRTLVPVARRLQNLAEESYRAGRANILTVVDAQRNVQQVERDYLDSLAALQNAFAQLEETVGASLD